MLSKKQLKSSLQKHIWITILMVVLLSVGITAPVVYVYANPSPLSTQYGIGGVYPGAPSYTIWQESGTYYAKNAYGYISYSGTNITSITLSVINSLPNGGEIRYSSGTYLFSVTGVTQYVIAQKPKITISGEGVDVTIFKATGIMPALGLSLIKMEENTVLKDLTIDMNGGEISYVTPAPNAWFGGVVMGDFLEGVTDKPATDSLVHNVQFVNCRHPSDAIKGLGLNCLHGSGIKVRDVQFYNNYVGLFITDQPTASNYAVYSNRFYDVNGVYGENNYILVNWEISSAILDRVKGRDNVIGVLIVATDRNLGYRTQGVLSNFVLLNSTGGGVICNNPPEWLQLNNGFINSTGSGAWGIRWVGSNSSTLTMNNINIYYAGTGFQAYDSGRVSWYGGEIAYSALNGIRLMCNATINGVVIHDNSGHGIYATSSSNETAYLFSENMIYNNDEDGIRLDALINAVVSGNYLYGNDIGIRSISVSDYNTIICNNAIGNIGSTDIAYTGTHNLVVYNQGRYTPQGEP